MDGLHHVDGNTDGSGLIRNGAGDGLADPPGGVGGELVALGVVELVHGLHQTQVALLDQIQEEHTAAHVALGDGDNQTEVSFHQRLLGLDVALGHALGQLMLPIGGEQGHAADLLEVEADGVIHQALLLQDALHILAVAELLHLVLDLAHLGARQLGERDAAVLQRLVELVQGVNIVVVLLQNRVQVALGELALLTLGHQIVHLSGLLSLGLGKRLGVVLIDLSDLHILLFHVSVLPFCPASRGS